MSHMSRFNMRYCILNSSLGVGTSEPVELGSVANRKLYMHLWVYAPGNETRKIEYTLYLESAGE